MPLPTVVYYVVPTVIALVGIRKYMESKWAKCVNIVQLNGKVAIVTGANSGIGYEIAKELVKRGAEVILACRDVNSGNKAAARIQKQLNVNTKQVCLELDLASLKSIRAFTSKVNSLYPKIHLLINNAGVSYPDGKKVLTKDGFEIQMGVNHLGHFLLTNLLLDSLQKEKDSRIIIVASRLHEKGNINLNDFNYEKVDKLKGGYANSKLANMYFCKELAKKLENGCSVYSICPGWVMTKLFRHSLKRMICFAFFVIPAAFLFMRSPKQGCQTAIFCATDPSLKDESGRFYRDCKRYTSNVNLDDATSKKLWELSETMIKEKELE